MTMKSKFSRVKAFFIAAACGGIPLITEATCDPYGAYFFRDDDYGDYYDDGFYYEDPFFYDPYCDPFYCY
jgi:hypothetical protein